MRQGGILPIPNLKRGGFSDVITISFISNGTNTQRYWADPSTTVFSWLILHMFTGIVIGFVVYSSGCKPVGICFCRLPIELFLSDED